jgi:dipeptidyl aminopeptidase/acylaminoacyl peptidase
MLLLCYIFPEIQIRFPETKRIFMPLQSRFLPVITVLLLCLSTAPLLAAGLTIDQLLDLEQVRAAVLSPDGRLAAYTVSQNRSLDEPAGSAWVRLYVAGLKDGTIRPFVTGQVTVGGVQFSPDGRYLSFTTKRGDEAKTQVWVLPVDGGEAQVATASATGVSGYAWSPDASALYFIDTDEASERETQLKDKGFDLKPFEENLKHHALRRVPFIWGAAPGESEALVTGRAVWSVQASPDGRWLIFGASARNLIDEKYVFQDIYRLDLGDGSVTQIIDTPGKLGVYAISPDSKFLAWTGAATQQDHAVSSLFVCDLDGGNLANLTPTAFAGHIRNVVWRDKQTLLYQSDEGVFPKLSTQSVRKRVPARKVILDSAVTGIMLGMPATRPGVRSMVLVGHNGTTPRELYRWDGRGELERLTHHNPGLAETELGEQRVVTWTARDGLVIEGLLMLPVGYSGGTFPLIVHVHGGPESNYSNGWLSRYAVPGQALCTRGYGVLLPNYRGSTGRGLEFAMASYGDPAGKEFDDVVDGVDHLIAEGLVDKNRVGVMGGSYGGYATNWLTTYYTERFAAGVAMVAVSDLISKRFLTNIPYEDEYVHMGKPVRESWDLMLERSPVKYAAQSRTPLLILHGDRDHRVHFSQSQEMFRALKMAGHPAVRLIYYPGEGHGNTKRFGRADFVHRTLAWFDHYLQDGNVWDGPLPALDISEEMGLLAE